MKASTKKTLSASKNKSQPQEPVAEAPKNIYKHLKYCDYKGILNTFESEIALIEQKKPLPQRINGSEWLYAGAAQAALVCGDRIKAGHYYFKLFTIVQMMRSSPTHGKELRWHIDTLKELESELLPVINRIGTVNLPN